MIELDALIKEMQDVKAKYSILSISEVLKIFEIKAMRDLISAIERARMSNG